MSSSPAMTPGHAHSRWPGLLATLALVCAGHVAALWALAITLQRSPDVKITPPAIIGVLVPEGPEVTPPSALPMAAEPATPPQPLHPPRPQTTPPIPAPPSERAVSLPPAPPVQAAEASGPDMDEASTAASTSLAEGDARPVVPPRADAAFLDNPAPRYPQLSRRRREEGRVLLDVFIRADGGVGDVKLKRSSGFTRLDDAAIEAVRRWRYVPAMRGTQALDYWHVQPLDFELDQ